MDFISFIFVILLFYCLPALIIGFTWMSFLWLIHLKIKNAALVDVGWSLCILFYALFYFANPNVADEYGRGFGSLEILVCSVLAIWALRLSIYLFVDRIYKNPEEGRYLKLREKFKTNVSLKFFIFYQAQAVVNILISLPFILIAINEDQNIYWFHWLGASVMLVGIIGESLADLQLRRFKQDKQKSDRVCRLGLWNYSRHPNYFFEWLVWVGVFICTIGSPFWYLAILSPGLMLFTLLKITGIPATEAQAVRSRGDEYLRYQNEVSMFVPLPKTK